MYIAIGGLCWDLSLVVIAGTQVESVPSLEGEDPYCGFLSTGDFELVDKIHSLQNQLS